LIDHPEKCIKQYAPTAKKNAKCHSNQAATDPYTAMSAGRSTDHQDVKDIRVGGKSVG